MENYRQKLGKKTEEIKQQQPKAQRQELVKKQKPTQLAYSMSVSHASSELDSPKKSDLNTPISELMKNHKVREISED